jgi:allophanate hydrolase
MIDLDIPNLLEAYRKGPKTPADTVACVYERIRGQGDDHVWIELVCEHDAMQRARELMALSKDLPLYGIPFAVKDNIDVAGMPTTAACPAFRYIAVANATAVQRLLEAGAILIGKTNMDQFATGLVGTRSPYGACPSVFHPEYISGGSSSGSAVAVAKAEVSFSLGTDTAGSGRVPAAFNGIVGLKPTCGLVSTAGVLPACRSLDCVSIFASDVDSAGAVLQVLAGSDERDPFSRSQPQCAARGKGFRVGVPRPDQMRFFGDEESATAWRRALNKATTLDADLIEVDMTPFYEASALLYSGPFVAERFAAVGEFIESNRECDFDPTVREIILRSKSYSASEAFRAQYRLQELRKETASVFDGVNCLLVPTAPTICKTSEVLENPIELNSRLGTYTNFVNLLDLCGIAIPAGMRLDGLPFGVTLLAPAFHDQLLLDVAQRWNGTPGRPYPDEQESIPLAVAGAHLRGQPLNWQLTSRGARFVKETRTAPYYKMFALSDIKPHKPGLVRVTERQQTGIEVEIWCLNPCALGSFVAAIPAPLGIGTLELENGAAVKGFLCEPYATATAEDITSIGAWRWYRARHNS